METESLCGLCLGRLRYQISKARNSSAKNSIEGGRVVLENYLTSDPDEIIDILEIYHVKDRTIEGIRETLSELAYSASVLTRERLQFDFNEEGQLALYLSLSAAAA